MQISCSGQRIEEDRVIHLEYILRMNTTQSHSDSDTLNASFLEFPIPSERQVKIVTQFCGSRHTYQTSYFRPYFQYYTEQSRIAYQPHGNNLAIRTHRYITDLASRIQDGLSRSEIYDFLEQCQWTSVSASWKRLHQRFNRLDCLTPLYA